MQLKVSCYLFKIDCYNSKMFYRNLHGNHKKISIKDVQNKIRNILKLGIAKLEQNTNESSKRKTEGKIKIAYIENN